MRDVRRVIPCIAAFAVLASACVNFGEPIAVTVSSGAASNGRAIALADVTGDGLDDPLVLVDETVTRLVTCGADCLAPAESISIPGANSLAAGDVDGDGVGDAVVGVEDVGVVVLFGGSSGLSLADSTTVELGVSVDGITDVALGDFNGDGVLDLLTAAFSYSYHLGDGDGQFGSGIELWPIFSSAGAFNFAIGDVDGNGDDEVVFAALAIPEFLIVTTLAATSYPIIRTTTEFPDELALGDLDGDGRDDLAVSNLDSIGVFRSTGSAWESTGIESELPLPTLARDLVLGDFDLSGTVDVIATNGSVVSWWNGSGDGSFAVVNGLGRYGQTLPFEPLDIAVGDVDGDGRDDLLMNSAGAPYGDVVLLLNASVNP